MIQFFETVPRVLSHALSHHPVILIVVAVAITLICWNHKLNKKY